MSPDFKVATVRLRQGLTFHNGDPVTAEDVEFSDDNYRGLNAALLHRMAERVEIVDAHTVRIHFKAPSPISCCMMARRPVRQGPLVLRTTICRWAQLLPSGTRSS